MVRNMVIITKECVFCKHYPIPLIILVLFPIVIFWVRNQVDLVSRFLYHITKSIRTASHSNLLKHLEFESSLPTSFATTGL